jgi:hypothetical protein
MDAGCALVALARAGAFDELTRRVRADGPPLEQELLLSALLQIARDHGHHEADRRLFELQERGVLRDDHQGYARDAVRLDLARWYLQGAHGLDDPTKATPHLTWLVEGPLTGGGAYAAHVAAWLRALRETLAPEAAKVYDAVFAETQAPAKPRS